MRDERTRQGNRGTAEDDEEKKRKGNGKKLFEMMTGADEWSIEDLGRAERLLPSFSLSRGGRVWSWRASFFPLFR